MNLMNCLRNIAFTLALLPSAQAADLGARNSFALQIQGPAEACKIDDASAVQLLYLNCIGRRDQEIHNTRDLNCLDPNQVIGRLYIDTDPMIPAPVPLRNARLKVHAIFEEVIAANPNPTLVLKELQTKLKKLESCKVTVAFWGARISDSEFEKIRYETDLADAIGLSFNEKTAALAADIYNQKILPAESTWAYGSVAKNIGKLPKMDGRFVTDFATWVNYGASAAFNGGWYSPMAALIAAPSESLYRKYGDPQMTEKMVSGCYMDQYQRAQTYRWKGKTLWTQSLASLVPEEEKAALAFSDTILNANVLNYWLVQAGQGVWSSRAPLPEGQKCPRQK